MQPAQQGRGLSTSLTSPTFVLPSSSWYGSGVMPLPETFSMALVVHSRECSMLVILAHRSVFRTDKPGICAESAYTPLVSVFHDGDSCNSFLILLSKHETNNNRKSFNKVVEVSLPLNHFITTDLKQYSFLKEKTGPFSLDANFLLKSNESRLAGKALSSASIRLERGDTCAHSLLKEASFIFALKSP